MMRSITLGIIVVATTLAAGIGSASAQPKEPTLTDIAECNAHADSKAVPSASPRTTDPPPLSRETTKPPEMDAGGRVRPQGPAAPERFPVPGRPGVATDSTGQIVTDAPDPVLRGMAAARADDPVYRAAYRECMKQRGY